MHRWSHNSHTQDKTGTHRDRHTQTQGQANEYDGISVQFQNDMPDRAWKTRGASMK